MVHVVWFGPDGPLLPDVAVRTASSPSDSRHYALSGIWSGTVVIVSPVEVVAVSSDHTYVPLWDGIGRCDVLVAGRLVGAVMTDPVEPDCVNSFVICEMESERVGKGL